jgi:hypothetical protein
MERLNFTLFTDTGGILLPDPEGAAAQPAAGDGDWGRA